MSTTLLPFQPLTMSTAQLAAVSYLARYSGRTHALYSFQLRRWFSWCETNGLDPLVGIQRAHIELYIGQLGESGLMDSSVVTMMHRDESRTQGLDRLELIRFLQVAQTITVHHADPRTTEHYDRARGNLDRHGVHFLTAYVAGVQRRRTATLPSTSPTMTRRKRAIRAGGKVPKCGHRWERSGSASR